MNDCPRQNPAYRPALTSFNTKASGVIRSFVAMIIHESVTTKILTGGKNHYLRYRVPKRIQILGFPQEVVKTLKTSDYLLAQNQVLFKIPLLQRVARSTDKTLLKSLFDEQTDFSFADQLSRHAAKRRALTQPLCG